jgi:hypothetical protein
MNQRDLPGVIALEGFAPFQDSNWNDWMDPNLLKLSVFVQGSVLSATTALPSTPTDGQIYIVPVGETEATKIAVRDSSEWVYYEAGEGMRLYVADESAYFIYNGTAWVADAGGGVTVQDGGTLVLSGANTLNFTGAGVAVTETAGVVSVAIAGGGSGGGASIVTASITQINNSRIASGGSTMGNRFIPYANLTIYGYGFALDDAAATHTYVATIVTLDGSDDIDTVVATSASLTGLVDDDNPFFIFATPVALVAGTKYAFLISRTDGTGNEVVKLYSSADPFLPTGRFEMPGRTLTGVRYETTTPANGQSPDAVFSTSSLCSTVFWSMAGL